MQKLYLRADRRIDALRDIDRRVRRLKIESVVGMTESAILDEEQWERDEQAEGLPA